MAALNSKTRVFWQVSVVLGWQQSLQKIQMLVCVPLLQYKIYNWLRIRKQSSFDFGFGLCVSTGTSKYQW